MHRTAQVSHALQFTRSFLRFPSGRRDCFGGVGGGVAHAQQDITPPSVVNRSPSAGAGGVARGVLVEATFSEPVQAATVAFELRTGGGLVPATVTYDATRRTAVLDPVGDLAAGQTYTATLSATRDLAGNALSAPVVWTFTVVALGFQDPQVLSGHCAQLHIEPWYGRSCDQSGSEARELHCQ